MDSIIDTYVERTPGSAAMDRRARGSMPGGDTRAVAYHRPYPLAVARAEGPYLWDVDGNRYLDLLGNYTSLVHGNAHPPIIEAATRVAGDGTQWAARNVHAVELAEMLCERLASVEKVRFTNSGSEATLLAVEIARVVTGRRKILMARFGYHGSGPLFEVGTHGHRGPETLLAEFGDADDFARVLAGNGDEIAAVIVEPVLGAGGIIVPPAGFVASVGAAARDRGALFILDEVITLRLGPGGCQGELGAGADLTTMGKIIGGGFPIGAVGGRTDLMAVTDPAAARLSPSGTFNGNPVSAAAGVVSLTELNPERIAVMAGQAERLATGIEVAGAAAGVETTVTRIGSLLNLYLGEPAPGGRRSDAEVIGRVHLALLNHGVFVAPRGMMALSTVLDDSHIDEAVVAVSAAIGDITVTVG